MQVHSKKVINEVQWYQTVREVRWPDGLVCPACQSSHGLTTKGPKSLMWRSVLCHRGRHNGVKVSEKKPQVIVAAAVACDEA